MEHFWEIFAQKYADSNRKVFLAYPSVTKISENLKKSTIEIVELTLPWKTPLEADIAKKFIKDNDISTVYFTDQNFFNTQYLLIRLYGVKKIVIHDHTPGDRNPTTGLKGRAKSILNSFGWFTANKFICVSDHMQQRNLANIRLPKSKSVVVQNGIHPVQCNPSIRSQLRASLSISNSTLVVITTGRANSYKRFDFVIDVASELFKSSPGLDIAFLIVGDGPAMKGLREQVLRENLAENVKLLGFRADVRDLLCAADIAFHAALGEGFSLSIVEYMSAQLPVILPNIPSVCQAIEHGVTGYTYDADDCSNAASHIINLYKNTALRKDVGHAAKKEANGKYTMDRCSREFNAVIRDF